MGLLDGKVAVITGAGRGIGRAEATLLASEGCNVLVNDVDEAAASEAVAAIVAGGGKATANVASVTDGAAAIMQAAIDAYGRIDILINNAGILRDKTLLKMSESMWDDVIAVHLKGTFLCTQLAAKQMIAQIQRGDGDGGRIINTTSVSGMRGNFGQANYAAAKAGIYGLTRTAAAELQKHRITVNAIAPIAKTRMTEDLPMFQGLDSLGPECVAPAALFLASDLVGDRTGHVLAVSGNRMYVFKVVEGKGTFKEEGEAWTAAEIAEHWDAIVKV